MKHSEYVAHDVLGLAGLIAPGQVNAADVLAAPGFDRLAGH